MTRTELMEAYAEGRRGFSCVNLSDANLFGANLSGADLSGADLSGANLFGANLFGADLSDANLSGANLSGANLFGANLSGASLSGASLSGASLSGANLSGANLSGANLSGAIVPIYSKYAVGIVDNGIKIGCKTKSIPEWDAWFAGTEEYGTSRDNPAFKRIEAHYRAAKAYLEHINT